MLPPSIVAAGTSVYYIIQNPTASTSSNDQISSTISNTTACAIAGFGIFIISIIKIVVYNIKWKGDEDKFIKHSMALWYLIVDGV